MGQKICQDSAKARDVYRVANNILGYDILEMLRDPSDDTVCLNLISDLKIATKPSN